MKTKNFLKAITLSVALCLNATMSFALTHWATATDPSTGNDAGFSSAVDGSGNVYTAGYSRTSGANYKFTVTKHNNAGTYQTIYILDGVNSTTEFETACEVVLGPSYVWVTGVAYNGGTNKLDLVLVKLSTGLVAQAGYPKYYADAGDIAGIGGHSLEVYDDSHVYVGGATYDGSTWKGITLKDSTSGWAWTKTFNGTVTTANTADVTDLKYDATRQKIYITGYESKTSQGKDTYTAKLNARSGALQTGWPRTTNGSANGDDVCNAMYFDEPYDRVYVAGYITTSNGTDAWIHSYDAAGGAKSGFPATYNGANNLDDKFLDLDGIGSACSTGLIYAVGYSTVATGGSHDENYILESFDTTNAGITCWGTNPVTYDGGGGAPEATGSDEGYGICYDAGLDIITIDGRSDETSTGLAITALEYSGATGYVSGTFTWKGTYDYGSNTIQTGENQEWYKYGLSIVQSGCYGIDFIYEASDYYNGSTYDLLTQEYYTTGNCIRMADPNLGSIPADQIGFYPNPFSNSAVLVFDGEVKISEATLKIYDVNGKEVLIISNLNSNTIPIERGDLKNGIYFYELLQNEQRRCNGKFVVIE